MVKILYATDPHFKARNPANRIDNYQVEMLMLLSELLHVAKDKDAVIIGGDFFDTPKVSQRLYNAISRLLRRFPCPVYVTPGNHDIFGEELSSIDETMLGSLESSGLVTLLTDEAGYFLVQDSSTTVAVYGKEYTRDRDTGDVGEDYDITPTSLADWHILSTHSMLLDRPFIGKHTLIKDVVTMADVVLGAHYHPGWDIITNNGVIFCHPGAMARLEATQTEATRTVQYAVIEATATDINVDLYPFKNAKPGHEILNLNANVSKKAQKLTLDAFRNEIQQTKAQPKGMTIDEQIKDSLAAQNLTMSFDELKSMTDLVHDLIVQAEMDLLDNDSELQHYKAQTSPVHIAGIHLINFQAYKDTSIDLDKGFNAILGESDSGKSAIIRALKWVFYNEPKGSNFIRHGEDAVSVTVHMSNGYSITRYRTRGDSGGYEVAYKKGTPKKFTKFGATMPIEVSAAHQSPKVQLTKDVSVSLNVSSQLDAPFMLSETPSTKAAIIGSLSNAQLFDAAIGQGKRSVLSTNKLIKTKEAEALTIRARLDTEFADMPQEKLNLESLNNQLKALKLLQEQQEKLISLQADYDTAKDELKASTEGLVQIAPLIKALEKVSQLEALNSRRQTIQDIRSSYVSATQNIQLADVALNNLPDYESIRNDIDQLILLDKQREERVSIRDNLKACSFTLKAIEDQISTNNIDPADIQALEQLIAQRNTLVALADAKSDADRDILSADNTITTMDEQLAKLTMLYQETLKEAGKCPVCSAPITDKLIAKIKL